MGVGFRVNGDVAIGNRTLRIFAQANQPDGATIAGGNISAQYTDNAAEYFQAFAVQKMKFSSPAKCEAKIEGRIGRARSLMTLSLDDTSDSLMVNITKNGVAWVAMSSPQPIRQSETDPAESGEYVRLYPPA